MLGNNPQLCYVGNFSRYLTDNTSTVCTSTSIVPRRDPAACSKLSLCMLVPMSSLIVVTQTSLISMTLVMA